MKNNSGRPRNVRRKGNGGKGPACRMCTWGRKEPRLNRARQKVQREMKAGE